MVLFSAENYSSAASIHRRQQEQDPAWVWSHGGYHDKPDEWDEEWKEAGL